MTSGAAAVGWSILGAGLAVVVLAVTRPEIPVLAQGLLVVVAAVVSVPVLRVARWRHRREVASGEQFGNRVLEGLRRRRDGAAYRPGGPRVELDPDPGWEDPPPGRRGP